MSVSSDNDDPVVATKPSRVFKFFSSLHSSRQNNISADKAHRYSVSLAVITNYVTVKMATRKLVET